MKLRCSVDWAHLDGSVFQNVDEAARARALEYCRRMRSSGCEYTPEEVSLSTNLYLSHGGGDPKASTATVFECPKIDVVYVKFLTTKSGLYYTNRGFMPWQAWQDSASQGTGGPVTSKQGVERALLDEKIRPLHGELRRLFALYVLPVSVYFWGAEAVFINPAETERFYLS